MIVPKSGPGFYLLDPEANLARTRATLAPVLERLDSVIGDEGQEHEKEEEKRTTSSSSSWTGIIGEAPTEDLLKDKLASASVFIYCGHGSGETFLAREEVAALAQAPFAILMGCSSGRLRPPVTASPELFEPTGELKDDR